MTPIGKSANPIKALELSFSNNSAFAISRKQTYVPTDDFVTNKNLSDAYKK